jgi:hypothetical protein
LEAQNRREKTMRENNSKKAKKTLDSLSVSGKISDDEI